MSLSPEKASQAEASQAKEQPEIGFGIIGLGMIAAKHAQAIKSVPGAKLVAALSSDAAKAADTKTARCQADFYAGMWRIVHKDIAGAAPLLKAATQSCGEDSAFHRIALAELAKGDAKGTAL